MPTATRTARKTTKPRAAKSAAKTPGKPGPKGTPTATPEKPQSTGKLNGIGSAAVEKATGNPWSTWLTLLDKAGAADMTHQEIAQHLSDKHGVGDWWCQMVTVGYEQARGRRIKHQTAKGFSISSSKTISTPVAALYRAWTDAGVRERWLPGATLTIRTATANKSLRITWTEARGTPTNLDVGFSAKGPAKSQVSVEHSKHKTAAAAQRSKKFWAARLEE